MEERRLEITRKTSDIARAYIADIIKKSVIDLRGEYPDQIREVINNLSFDHSHIPEITFNNGDLFTEKRINNLLELIYIDLLIQYGDIYAIQDILREMKHIFESVITAHVVKASELASTAHYYKKFSLSQFDFTDIFHESFNSVRNHTKSDYACEINNGAGVIRMPGVAEHCARIETSDIYLVPHSTAIKIVDESDPSSAYSDDMTDPYFITVFSTGNPKNNDVPAVILSSYNGLIVDIIVRFNTVVPVTRVSFKPFSNAPVDIIGIFYSVVPEGKWNLGDIHVARLWDLSYDTDVIEANFRRIYARELHILVHQSSFVLVRADIDIENILSTKEYIAAVSNNLEYIMPDGFTEHDNLQFQIEEITSFLHDKTNIQTERPAPNTRVYVIGLIGLEVSNVSYMHFGDYRGTTRHLTGNIHTVSFLQDGTITRSEDGIIDSCALFSIQTAGEDIYIGYTTSDGRVIDGAIMQANNEYHKGAMVKNSAYPYKFETHFRPHVTFSGLEIYNNGIAYALPPETQVEHGNFSTTVKLPREFCITNNLLEGTVLTMLYDVDSYDLAGRPYDVARINIAHRIGRPHIAVNEIAYIKDSYLYVPTGSGSISYAPSLSAFEPSEWNKVMISGEVYYHVSEDKGLPLDGINVFENAGNWYIHESCASGPFDDFYYGSLMEEPEYITTSGMVHILQSEVPYMIGTLKAFSKDRMIPDTTECAVDTTGALLSNDEKRIFTIPSSYNQSDIKVCYIPIDRESITDTIGSNIAHYTSTDQFSKTTDGKISLSRFPYTDPDIISSESFAFRDGVFYLKWMYSVTYEPLVVFVNGVKAINITDYRMGINNRPPFRVSYREDDYQYYTEAGKTIVFNKDIAGTIIVYYYQLSDTMRERIEMYRSNYSRDDVSPEVYSYTLLGNIQR